MAMPPVHDEIFNRNEKSSDGGDEDSTWNVSIAVDFRHSLDPVLMQFGRIGKYHSIQNRGAVATGSSCATINRRQNQFSCDLSDANWTRSLPLLGSVIEWYFRIRPNCISTGIRRNLRGYNLHQPEHDNAGQKPLRLAERHQ